MPNITMFVEAEKMPPSDALAELTDKCTELCTSILRASTANVHIIYVAVRQGRGHPIFAEVRYRFEPFRTPSVIDWLMERLDGVIRSTTGLTARIRCFGYAEPSIRGRN